MKWTRWVKWSAVAWMSFVATGCGQETMTSGRLRLANDEDDEKPIRFRRGIVDLGYGPMEVGYEIIDGRPIFEGDIRLNQDELDRNDELLAEGRYPLASVTQASLLWPGGIVPIRTTEIDSNTSKKAILVRAMKHIELNTPIRFVAYTNQSDYLNANPIAGSSAGCGLSGNGRQGGEQDVDLPVSGNCTFFNAYVHELLHAIATYHEQSRADRDNYVTIDFDNVTNTYAFETYIERGQQGQDIGPYNFASIMHYHSTAFQGNQPTPTIVRNDGRPLAPSQRGMSMGDTNGIRMVYCSSLAWDPTRCNQQLIVGDYDGDGRRDFAYLEHVQSQLWVSSASSFGAASFSTERWPVAGGGQLDSNEEWTSFATGNVDGDGQTEILGLREADGKVFLMNPNPTAKSFVVTQLLDMSNGGWATIRTGKFNGDANVDLAVFHPDEGRWFVALGNGNGTFGPLNMWTDYSNGGWTDFVVGDFAGDSKDDVATYYGPDGKWFIGVSNGSAFNTSNVPVVDYQTVTGWSPALVGNFGGDAKKDIAHFHNGTGRLWVTILSPTQSTTMFSDYSDGSWTNHVVADFDQDNRDDIASYNIDPGRWFIGRSTGTAFVTMANGGNAHAATLTPGNVWSSQIGLDFTGDGIVDLLNFDARTGRLQAVVGNQQLFFSSFQVPESCPGMPNGLCNRLGDLP